MSSRFLTAIAVSATLLTSAAARAEFKAAYVDLQRALLEVDEGRGAKTRLQKILDEKQKEIDREQEALRKEKEVLDKQASAMSEETRIQKQIELQKKLVDLTQKWDKGRQEMADKERKELQAIFSKMDPIIAKIAADEGITMVFEKTDSGLVYAPQSLDLTNELVRRYNATYKGGGAGKGGSPKETPKDAPKDAPKK